MPVAEIVSSFGNPETFGERELIALKDIQKLPYGTTLYAEQSVALVMPARKCERKLGQAFMENYRNGWNDCLDEVARLNLPKSLKVDLSKPSWRFPARRRRQLYSQL